MRFSSHIQFLAEQNSVMLKEFTLTGLTLENHT